MIRGDDGDDDDDDDAGVDGEKEEEDDGENNCCCSSNHRSRICCCTCASRLGFVPGATTVKLRAPPRDDDVDVDVDDDVAGDDDDDVAGDDDEEEDGDGDGNIGYGVVGAAGEYGEAFKLLPRINLLLRKLAQARTLSDSSGHTNEWTMCGADVWTVKWR
jgi:hypothetical protein